MEWFQVLAIIVAVFGMFLWLRRESNSDMREMRGLVAKISNDIHQEMKDFHGRLCTIEEKNRGK